MLPVRAHGGGMMAGSRRQAVTPQLRDFVVQHDKIIAQRCKQVFGAAYIDGLLRDSSAVFDSEPPTAAMLAAEKLAGRGLDMLAALQLAHYVDGRQIADRSVLVAVAQQLGLDPAAFANALDQQSGHELQEHIRQTRAFMDRIGAQGFPTLVLESGDSWQQVDLSPFMGRPAAFGDWLRTQLVEKTAAAGTSALVCDSNGCNI